MTSPLPAPLARTALRLAPLLALALLFAAPARALQAGAGEAESFVQNNAREVIETLRAYSAGDRDLASVKAEFRNQIEELADVERVTNFVLGRYRRTGEAQAVAEFREVFREYAISIYENELANYSGQTLEVTGSVTRAPGDYIVRSRLTGGGQDPVTVNWRVLDSEAGLRVVDVQVADVWLAQTQREQITSIIGDAGGDVSAATRALRERLQG